ncbi:MAG: dTMP kinase, partial [Euryarchaeota archaeon]|nr:dTMP kinase [Euryarchaeota archaeon]
SLEHAGVAVVWTTEPTRTWRGDAVKWAIERDVDAVTEAFLFLADREAHSAQIRAWMNDGKLVLSDRYVDSTYAYQGARMEGKRERPVEWLRQLCEPYIVIPHVTFFLAVPPEVGLDRIAGRARKVRFEEVAFLRRVDAIYRELAKEERFVTIDATHEIGEVVGEIGMELLRRYPG